MNMSLRGTETTSVREGTKGGSFLQARLECLAVVSQIVERGKRQAGGQTGQYSR
jgi:hypothetical protein